MNEIQGKARTIRELLSGTKYSIDYYQREYKWERKQVQELIDDLTSRFARDYEKGHPREAVESYGHYFLGSIIVSRKDGQSFLVDGQQRLTTLTLLLIFLHNAQRERHDASPVDEMIFSEKYGRKSFNLEVDERTPCMEALFDQTPYDATGKSESVANIVTRYEDVGTCFPDELAKDALPYFVDWLKENVHLVEITAYSDEDAYTIFETMNDRGLSLTPTDMLKGYLLANITDGTRKDAANTLWKRRVLELAAVGKDVDADFFKAWIRSQYAESIRAREKGARPEDFDLIGTEYHRWVKDHKDQIGLDSSLRFAHFIEGDFDFYSRQYLRLMSASTTLMPGLEHVYYNARLGFTSQYQVLLAPLTPDDGLDLIDQKFRIVATYLDILLNRRLWNWHLISYSTMQYAMFLVTHEIRGLPADQLAERLYERLANEKERFATNEGFSLTQLNREYVRLILARMTDYVERGSGMSSHYMEYVAAGTKRYEVEHIWANKPERHVEEFPQATDFATYRNRVGGLLLLPKSFNASYGALSYAEKLPHYNAQNLLARTLNPQCYEHNPGFLAFLRRSDLPFKPHAEFRKADFDDRRKLYCQLAERVWDPKQLLAEVAR